MDLRPGAVVAGRYRVDRKVGSGGMGEVWSGDHLAIGTRVALKTMLPAAAVNHEVVARFKREAYLLGRIRSDYVARVVDFVADDNFGLVLVMEFVEGVSLARILTERNLTVEEAVEVGCDLASALCDLHRAHIVHRDLKPGNVILSQLADRHFRAVVVDFGVSRLMSAGDENEETITGITRADMAVGTIEYMSPEQILNSRSVTLASDIYAVGAILFRAVAGQHVFGDVRGESELAQYKLTQEAPPLPIPHHDRLAVALREAVGRTLRRRPSERFTSAEQMVEAFAPLRELVRVAAVDLDSTTQDVQSGVGYEATGGKVRPAAGAIPASYLAPHDGSNQQPPPSGPRAPFASAGGEHSLSGPYGEVNFGQRQAGIPIYVVVLAVVLALAGGAVASALLLVRRDATATATAGSATAAPDDSAAPSANADAPPMVTEAPLSSTPPSGAAPSASAVGLDAGVGLHPSAALPIVGSVPRPNGLAPWPPAPASAPSSTYRPPQHKPEPPPLDLDAPAPPVNPKF